MPLYRLLEFHFYLYKLIPLPPRDFVRGIFLYQSESITDNSGDHQTILSSYLGGWDAALKLLVVLMVIDYVTGFLGAIKNNPVLLDKMVVNPEPILRTLAIYFYVMREGLSVTENLGIIGVPLPPRISRVLSQLQKKDDSEVK